MSAKIIKLTDNNNVTLIPVTDASVVQMSVDGQVKSVKDVILEIEMQGACQVKKNYSDAVLIFVLPPSLKVLRERLEKRNSDSPEQIIKRTEATLSEIHRINEYDYFVINGELDEAVGIVKNIMNAVHGDEDAAKLVKKNKVGKAALKMIKKYDEEAK